MNDYPVRTRRAALTALLGISLLGVLAAKGAGLDQTNSIEKAEREPLGPSSRRTGLVISEIMYHPAARSDAKSLEFIELFNSETTFINIGGYRLSGSIDFIFPTNQVIAAGEFLVVAKSPPDMAAVYGLNGVLGGWTHDLPGDSGTVRLQNNYGAILLEVPYATTLPWPAAADGAGHSLVLARPSYGENDPAAWSASEWAGGSPGTADPANVSPLKVIRINEILANSGESALDFVELYNHSTQTVALGGCVLTDDPATNRFVFPADATIPPGGFVALDQTQLGFGLKSAGETLYLFSSTDRWVVDAVRFSSQAPGISSGRYPDGATEFRELKFSTPGAANRDLLIPSVVINEIMYHPISGNEDDQYVELYNRGPNAIDISHWRFTTGIDFTFPAGTVIPADGYLVAARNAARLKANYSSLNAQNTCGNFTGKLSKRGERLALALPVSSVSTNNNQLPVTNTFYAVVNEITYGTGGRWGRWADGGGSSLELIDARSDNRQPSNWADSDETAKAPWTTIEQTGTLDLGVGAVDSLQLFLQGVGECLVDDVEAIPEGGTNRIVNSTFESAIAGWFMQGTHDRSSLETTEGFNSSQSMHLRADGRGDPGANRIRTTLLTPRPVVGKTATIRAKARWLCGSPELLLRFRGNWLEAAGRLETPANLGTPGARNSRAIPNAGPAIYEVAHHPILPAPLQDVVVTARVDDPDGLAQVVLHYRVDPDTTTVAVPLVDDGTGGDAVAHDGLFSATVPGQAQGAVVAFQVQAADNAMPNATAFFPSAAPARECLIRFGEVQPSGSIGAYRVWLTKNNSTKWSSRLKLHNTPLDATFVYGNSRVIYNSGAAYAGSPFIRPGYTGPAGALCGYELEFPNDDRFLGDTGMTLDYPVRDDTLQLEQIAYWMADQLGVANNRRRFVHLFVNGSKRGKIYEDAQRPDPDLLDQFYAGAPDGDLFKLDDSFEFDDAVSQNFQRDNGDTAATLENFTTTGGVKKTARYRWHWRKRTSSTGANDYVSLFALVNAMNSRDESYADQVRALVDVDQWMRVLTVEHMVGNWDSYGYSRGKNMYAYKPNGGRWQLVMWDIDFVMSAQGNPANGSMFGAADPVINRMLNHPAFNRAYYQAMREAVDGPLVAANVEPLLDAKYAGLVTNGISPTKPTAAKTYIKTRRSTILTQLDALKVDFSVFSNAGQDFATNQNWVELTGTAPLDLKSITVNGIEYPLTWQNTVVWTMRVPLNARTNAIVIQGIDTRGNLWPTNPSPFAIHYTGPFEQPRDFLVINEIMYHPPTPGAEFVEIFNASTNCAFDLSQYRLEGTAFTFAPGTVIGPRKFVVVVQDRTRFLSAYGGSMDIAGEFSGRLNPAGETLRLVKPGTTPADDSVVDEVAYGSQFPWPAAADGQGGSLQLLDPAQNHQHPSNWGAISAADAARPDWRFVSVTGTATTNTHLLIYHSPYQAPRPFNDIAGKWTGFIDVGSPYDFSAAFQKQDDTWTGTVNLGSDIPLNSGIKVITNSVRFGFNYGEAISWDGRLTPDGNTIKGTFTQPGYSFPFTLNRQIDPENYPGGEVCLDDLMLVAGTVPATGVNRIRNGDFETPLTNTWFVATNHIASSLAESPSHSGRTSLRLVADFGGQDEQSAVWQAIDSLEPGQTYTLSYWYLPSTEGRELTVRLADSTITSTHKIAPATAATPGAPNSIGSNDDLRLPLFLTEAQSENPDGIQDAQSHRAPWVELFNAGANPVSLGDCYLSPVASNLQQWAFPADAVLSPGQYRIVWLDGAPGETTAAEWHANFQATPTNGMVILSRYKNNQAAVLDSLAYQHLVAGQSCGQTESHQIMVFTHPTPGQPNLAEPVRAAILINEWMADNARTLADPSHGNYADWFELYNPNTNTVDLSGYCLTDDLTDKRKWVAPPGTEIRPGGFLLIWADGDATPSGANNELHANFKLGKTGETIGLYAPDGTLVDSVSFGPQTTDVSQGRWPDGNAGSFCFMTKPTPGVANVDSTNASTLRITALNARLGEPLVITWITEPDRVYQIQFTDELANPAWQNLGAPVKASAASAAGTDPTANLAAQRFYRVELVQ